MEYKIAAESLIARMQHAIRNVLRSVIPDGPVAMVDYPDFANVGDSAIWLGQSLYLRRERGVLPSHCCSITGYSAEQLERDLPTGAILICGGGNFGTLWPHHQAFRIALLERFRGRPVIQMPQSIHFSDDASIAATARAIGGHGAFTLLVRDQASYEFATRHFDCAVHLCPDMAFYIGRARRRAPEVDVLCLMRTDVERDEGLLAPPGLARDRSGTMVVTDWLEESRFRLRARRRLSGARHLIAGRARRRAAQCDSIAWDRFARGARTLSRGRVVVTDRLHAHILSVLLDIPHVALDNAYGKLGGFIEAWTGGCTNLRRARSMAEALACARELLSHGAIP